MQPLKCGYLFVQEEEERKAHIELHGMELPQMLLSKGIYVLGIPVETPEAVERVTRSHSFG